MGGRGSLKDAGISLQILAPTLEKLFFGFLGKISQYKSYLTRNTECYNNEQW